MLKRVLALTVVLVLGSTAAVASGSAWGSTAAVASGSAWQSSAPEGLWQHGGFLFQNDMWNCPQAACGKQTIWANSASDWGAVSTMAAGNTAVLTYPDIGKVFNDRPVSSFSSLRDGFTESMPRQASGLSAEAANDVWLNHYGIEMMIWVDRVGRSLDGGTRLGSATISGQRFGVWRYGGNEFIFVLDHNETSGQTHILASIDWLIGHGYIPARATLTQVEFGWEIASTGGRPAAFHISRFWLRS